MTSQSRALHHLSAFSQALGTIKLLLPELRIGQIIINCLPVGLRVDPFSSLYYLEDDALADAVGAFAQATQDQHGGKKE